MKKNKRLLYILGNIPEKYIDESMTEQSRKAKIQWKYIVTAAACFIVIAAIPGYMIKKSLSEHGNNIGTVTQVTEITTSIQTDTTNSVETEAADDVHVQTPKSCKFPGTGPEKPADYTPITNCPVFYEGYDLQDGYLVINNLKDRQFQEKINSDIRNATDSLKPYFDQKYMEYTRNLSYPSPWEIPENTNGLYISPSSRNGYLSIVLGYVTEMNPNDPDHKRNFDHIAVLNYDLVEQKKIESLTDLFYKDEDVLSLINNVIKREMNMESGSVNTLVEHIKNKDFDGLTEIPELFTIDNIYFSQDNPYFDLAPEIELIPMNDQSIIDHMSTGKRRDNIKDAYMSSSESEESFTME